VTRDAALPVLTGVTVAPITRTARGIRSEVKVGAEEGLDPESVITCDNLLTVNRRNLDPEPIGVLGTVKRQQLDRALRYSLAIRG
jgi:mRNA interferase MazF